MPLPQRISAVFLDVGGPIYRDETFVEAVSRALDEMLAERGAGPADRELIRTIYDEIRDRQDGSFRTALARQVLGDVGARGELHRRTEPYWRHPAGTLYEDVRPFLSAVHGKVRIGVLANQEAAVIDALRRDGLGELIDIWGVSAVVGYEKPSRELFDWCLAQAGTDPAHAVHVGNRLDNDVRPAAALGLSTVWVLRGDAPDEPTADQLGEPDLTVRSLAELTPLILDRTAENVDGRAEHGRRPLPGDRGPG